MHGLGRRSPSMEARLDSIPRMTIEMSTYISGTHDPTDLLHRVEIRAQTTVHGENLLVDDRRNRQTVEAVGESLPELDVVSPLALVVETIDTVDRGTLVVAAQNEEILGVLDLVCQEQANGFERLLATIHVVPKEEVVGFRGESTVFEQTKEIVVLSVDVTANLKTDQKHVSRGFRVKCLPRKSDHAP